MKEGKLRVRECVLLLLLVVCGKGWDGRRGK
jgi:hypothetical protein